MSRQSSDIDLELGKGQRLRVGKQSALLSCANDDPLCIEVVELFLDEKGKKLIITAVTGKQFEVKVKKKK